MAHTPCLGCRTWSLLRRGKSTTALRYHGLDICALSEVEYHLLALLLVGSATQSAHVAGTSGRGIYRSVQKILMLSHDFCPPSA